MRPHALAIVSLLLASVSVADAAVLRVALDGSGDFEVIQDAIAAAASGDTITIGPGTYTQTRMVPNSAGNLIEVFGRVAQSELTIIGDGREDVIIGPEEPGTPWIDDRILGIVSTFDTTLHVSGVTVRNVYGGVDSNGAALRVEDSEFFGNFIGIVSLAEERTEVFNCVFHDQEDRGIVVVNSLGATGAYIESCLFENNRFGVDLQSSASVVNACEFRGGAWGSRYPRGEVQRSRTLRSKTRSN
jgi:hypothetical protein